MWIRWYIKMLCPTVLVILLVFTNQVKAETNQINQENDDTIETKSSQYNDTASRQSSRIKFDQQDEVENGNEGNGYGRVTFEDQPIEDRPNLPFRFENEPPGGNNYNYNQYLDLNNNNNSELKVQRYGIQKPDLHESNIQAGYGLKFQDDNRIEGNQVNPGQKKKKRRRRRRKPKFQKLPGQGYGLAQQGGPFQGQPGPNDPYQGQPVGPNGFYPEPVGPNAAFPGPFGSNGPYPGQIGPSGPYSGTVGPSGPYPDPNNQGGPIYPGPLPGGQFYRPPRRRRPRPSVAEEALVSITTALTSIARYDDFQCVPRLLCEVAGGRAPTGDGSGVLQTIVNLQPLVTLLAAYNGVSTSPLFVFGRAVFLGMTSKGNAGTCRYAYPQCPTDPEKLVEYLNNHNGGFFRFFNAPQQLPGQFGQQNLEQFYNHLSNMQLNYGTYPNGLQVADQQGYGFPTDGSQPGYGLHNGNQNEGYGFQNGLYQNGNPQNYGNGYPYQNNGYGFPNPNHYKSNEKDEKTIEKRIQNRPDVTYVDNVEATKYAVNSQREGNSLKLGYSTNNYEEIRDNTKFSFPENSRFKTDSTPHDSVFSINTEKPRFGRTIKFPENDILHANVLNVAQSDNKKAKGFNFPESQSNRQYIDYYDYPPFTKVLDNTNLKLDESGYYVESNEDDAKANNFNVNQEAVDIVYVLRGNSDPNHPEVIKLKPGQKL